MSPKIPAADARRSETPNAVMTTLASPTLGGTARLALWRVRMEPGQAGPVHSFDSEQVWTVVAGAARATVDGEPVALSTGDTLVLPGGVVRRIEADGAFEAVVAGCAGQQAHAEGREPATPPWIA
jgi:quercetin dioxygenase-like cupin family protein